MKDTFDLFSGSSVMNCILKNRTLVRSFVLAIVIMPFAACAKEQFLHARIDEIRNAPDSAFADVDACYYLSGRGDDKADGRTLKTAWRTIERLNQEPIRERSVVLFERGGVYRGSVRARSGVTYAAYGSGAKPCICVSPEDGADPKKWVRTENPKVWAYDIGHLDVGTLVFDDGAAHAIKIVVRTDQKSGRRFSKYTGRKFDSYRDLDRDLHFWHDYYEDGTGKVYLFSEHNPGERFKSIEFNVKSCGFEIGSCTDVEIDNLTVKYAGIHGVAAGTCRNLTVRNCEFDWIGGSIQMEDGFGRDYPTRLGNGVEIYGGCDGYVVSNCYFHQIYDAGVTHQFNIPEQEGMTRYDQRHVRYVDNVFEKCNYSVEYFLTALNGNKSLMEDVLVEGNLMYDAGFGFCEQRADRYEAAHIKAWYKKDRNRARNFVIRDNVICRSKDMLIQTCSSLPSEDGASSLPLFLDNTVIACEGDCFGNISDTSNERLVYGADSQPFMNAFGRGNKCIVLRQEGKSCTSETGIPFAWAGISEFTYPDCDFPITNYGAVSDGRKCTQAFAKAMEACSAAGGGRVVVPNGRWVTGPIHFKNNCDLHLSANAVVEFTDEPEDYLPVVLTSWEGVECLNYSPLIYAYCCTNVAITGSGIIAPRMDRWRQWFYRTDAHMKATECLYHWCSTNAPLSARNVPAIKGSNVRPHLIQMNRVKNVRLDGFRIRESPFWMIHLYQSENCVVRNLLTCAHGHNNDGVDIEMSRNVLVENCVFDQGDDGIVLKSGRNQDAWRMGKPTENVVVTNCTFRFAHTLLGIGSELSGGIRNVYMAGCRINGAYNLLYIKTNRRRGGFVENVTVENIDTDSVRDAVFGLKTDVLYQWANFPDYELRRTKIRNVNVRHVHANCADWLFDITADAQLPAEGLHFDDVSLGAARKGVTRIENARDVTMKDVYFGSKEPREWVQPIREIWHEDGR